MSVKKTQLYSFCNSLNLFLFWILFRKKQNKLALLKKYQFKILVIMYRQYTSSTSDFFTHLKRLWKLPYMLNKLDLKFSIHDFQIGKFKNTRIRIDCGKSKRLRHDFFIYKKSAVNVLKWCQRRQERKSSNEIHKKVRGIVQCKQHSELCVANSRQTIVTKNHG